MKARRIKEVLIARKSPWQNPFDERAIGSIRREWLDHLVPFGERHLLRGYVEYYNTTRTHPSLDGKAPVPRVVVDRGEVVGEPVLGGLHHSYMRAA